VIKNIFSITTNVPIGTWPTFKVSNNDNNNLIVPIEHYDSIVEYSDAILSLVAMADENNDHNLYLINDKSNLHGIVLVHSHQELEPINSEVIHV
jgi:hypothetical protein